MHISLAVKNALLSLLQLLLKLLLLLLFIEDFSQICEPSGIKYYTKKTIAFFNYNFGIFFFYRRVPDSNPVKKLIIHNIGKNN